MKFVFLILAVAGAYFAYTELYATGTDYMMSNYDMKKLDEKPIPRKLAMSSLVEYAEWSCKDERFLKFHAVSSAACLARIGDCKAAVLTQMPDLITREEDFNIYSDKLVLCAAN